MSKVFAPCSVYGIVESLIRDHKDWTDEQIYDEVHDMPVRCKEITRLMTQDEWQSVITTARDRINQES